MENNIEELDINNLEENNEIKKETKQSKTKEHEVIVNSEKAKIIFLEKEMLIKTKSEKYLIPYEVVSKTLNVKNNLKDTKSKLIKKVRMAIYPIFFITLLLVDFNIFVKMIALSFLLYAMYLTFFNKKEVLLKISNGKMSYDYIKIQFKEQLFVEELNEKLKNIFKKKFTLARFF
jgi:hypothetical protein